MPRKWCVWITVAAMAGGTVCRVGQYLSHQSFWGDEAYLVLNVRDKSPGRLLGSLTMTVAGQAVPPQSAPPLYLVSLKGLAFLGHESEYAYRLPALVMGILALPLLGWLAWRLLDPAGAAIAVAWAAFSDRMIDGSSLVKQYSGDMALAIGLMCLATLPGRRAATRLLICSLATAVAVWYSEPLVFVMAGIGLALLPAVLREMPGRRGWLAWIGSCAIPLASSAALYVLSMRHQQDVRLYEYWAGLFPDYAHPLLWPVWLVRQTYGLCNYSHTNFGAIMLPLAALGIRRWRREGRPVAMLLLPILLALGAAALHRYPFGGARVDMFLVPAVLLLGAAGVAELSTLLPAHRARLAWLAAAPMVLVGTVQAGYHLIEPRGTSQLRPVVEFVRQRYQPGDRIVLEGGNTWPVFYCYWPQPPGQVHIVGDGETASVSGRFWCLCEYGPGEYARKRKPTIDAISAGATSLPEGTYIGRCGAALLFRR